MFIQLENDLDKFVKYDSLNIGKLYKGKDYDYILQDLYKNNEKVILKSKSFVSDLILVSNMYLCIVGFEYIRKNKDFNLFPYILQMEYENQKQTYKKTKIEVINIPSKILMIKSNLRPTEGVLPRVYTKEVKYIIEKHKTHLKGSKQPYIEYLCDNYDTGTGLDGKYFTQRLLTDKVLLWKCTKLDGYILKINT